MHRRMYDALVEFYRLSHGRRSTRHRATCCAWTFLVEVVGEGRIARCALEAYLAIRPRGPRLDISAGGVAGGVAEVATDDPGSQLLVACSSPSP